MHTRTEGVYAAGDCAEIPHGVTKVPIQGLSGSHAYAQGWPARAPPAGTGVPAGRAVGHGGRQVDDRGRLGETTANRKFPYIMGVAEGISRARYYPEMKKIR